MTIGPGGDTNGVPVELIMRIRRLAFCRLLGGGPVAASDLAAPAAVDESQAVDAVAALVAARRAVAGEDGRIIGIAGLSLVETGHRLRLDSGASLWCWCAWDAVGIASGMRLTAAAETSCGSCGAPLTVTFTGGQLTGYGAEYGYRPARGGSSLSCFCPYALLFCSADHLGRWQQALPAGVTGEQMPVARYAAEATHGWSWAAEAVSSEVARG